MQKPAARRVFCWGVPAAYLSGWGRLLTARLWPLTLAKRTLSIMYTSVQAIVRHIALAIRPRADRLPNRAAGEGPLLGGKE